MGTFTNINDYYRHLRKRGYVPMGKGLYSYVVAKPGSDRVIKMGKHSDGMYTDGWPGYIEWSIIHGYNGTFAPKVYSMRFYPTFYVAVVERLVCTINDIHNDNGYRHNSTTRLHQKMNDWKKGTGDYHDDEYPDLRKFCRQCRLAMFANDMHAGNVMLRKDGQIVVTDPCSEYMGHEETPSYKHR